MDTPNKVVVKKKSPWFCGQSYLSCLNSSDYLISSNIVDKKECSSKCHSVLALDHG